MLIYIKKMNSDKNPASFRSPYLPPLNKSSKKTSKFGKSAVTSHKHVIKTSVPIIHALPNQLIQKNVSIKGQDYNKSNLLRVNKEDRSRKPSYNGSSSAEDLDHSEIRVKLNATFAENSLLKSQIRKFSTENARKSKQISQLNVTNRSLGQFKEKCSLLELRIKEIEVMHRKEVLNLKKEILQLKNELMATKKSHNDNLENPKLVLRSKSAIDKKSLIDAKNMYLYKNKKDICSKSNESVYMKAKIDSFDHLTSINKNRFKVTNKEVQTDKEKLKFASKTSKAVNETNLKKEPFIKPPLSIDNVRKKTSPEKTMGNNAIINRKFCAPVKAFPKDLKKSDEIDINSIRYIQSVIKSHLVRDSFLKSDNELSNLVKSSHDADIKDISLIQSSIRNFVINDDDLNI